jgi:hypothetical protein
MGIFARDKAKNWIERKIQTTLRDNKITILIFLIIISGFFFYNQLSGISVWYFARNYDFRDGVINKKAWIAGIFKVEGETGNGSVERRGNYLVKNEIALESNDNDSENLTKNRLRQLVGDAPIREMVPSITKLDKKVAAFMVGIAKKESDWGKHAPSQGGETCYNYWGYKGAGSRGTSMGYACFGSPEEAVGVVSKKIEKLVSNNISEPKEMLVWKCGSSCAGHDPAGVQKWVSDVSLYFGKAMQI